MNLETLKKLARNPHYKLSDKQKRALRDAERKPIKSFGPPETHNATVPKHDVKVTRRPGTAGKPKGKKK